MVPFGAGSATDIMIRIVGEQMRQQTGHGFVVENKPGAFGILAIEEMVKARPDGYTLQVGNPGTNVLTPIIYKRQVQDRLRQGSHHGDAARRDSADPLPPPPRTSRRRPTPSSSPTPRPTPARCATPASASAATTTTTPKPSRSGPASSSITSRTRAAAARSPTTCCAATSMSCWSTPQARRAWRKSGMLRVLAVMADERLPEYPDAPTLKELGYAGRQGPVVGALRAGEDAARRARDAAPADGAGAQRRAGADPFKKQMIKAVPNASIADAQAWNKHRDRALEEAHRDR